MKVTTILKNISDEIEHLFSLSKEPVSIIKKAGEVIIKERQPGSFMYVIKSGAVDIEHKDTRLERVTKDGNVSIKGSLSSAARRVPVQHTTMETRQFRTTCDEDMTRLPLRPRGATQGPVGLRPSL